ncbi:hypothetical protein B0T24DRAFT_629139 [Lasiosphaeria ovina]|uniref:Secreted protein n=1 Tax=Lasiosphaeria ovina TaxID=92902 RepID=A0AAE0K780_9PEZI|nr:hypothetical protein B0T24DRAFT_629139 [Lasiosphaeria ovina]
MYYSSYFLFFLFLSPRSDTRRCVCAWRSILLVNRLMTGNGRWLVPGRTGLVAGETRLTRSNNNNIRSLTHSSRNPCPFHPGVERRPRPAQPGGRVSMSTTCV